MFQKYYSMKFVMRTVLVSIFLLLFNKSDAQIYKWKMLRYELIGGLGLTNFMGDVGAPKDEGLKSYFWTNPNLWRPVGVIGLRMAFSERHMVKSVISAGVFYADDAYGAKVAKQFEVLTLFTEFSLQYEYYLIPEQPKRNIYRFLGFSQRFVNFKIPVYLFGGVSGLLFNPKARFDGKWVSLQPMQTEVLENGKDKYSRIALAIPFGFGFKFKIAKYASINIEAGWRFAFTDYIDDVGSGEYPDLRKVARNGDYERAALSWRGHGYAYLNEDLKEILRTSAPGGGSRGVGDWFDQYQFITAKLSVKLKSGRKGGPKLQLYK